MPGLENVLIITKPIKGIYGSCIQFQGDKEREDKFKTICANEKTNIGLMQKNDTNYEFLHQNQESIRAFAFQTAEKINVPVLFF